jgi:hypothetical protein
MIVLTQLAEDNFATDANASPLPSPPWSLGTPPTFWKLAVVSGLCVGSAATANNGCENYVGSGGFSLPNDQYASANIPNVVSFGQSVLQPSCRAAGGNYESTGYLSFNAGYTLVVQSAGFFTLYYVTGFTYTMLGTSEHVTGRNNDIWTIAAIGTTVFVLQNGVIIISVSNSTYSSGFTSLGLENDEGTAATSLFSTGSASAVVATPTLSFGAGAVTVSNTDSGLSGFEQYYTTDGSTPTILSTLYSGPFTITLPKTVQVVAVATGYTNSAIASTTFLAPIPVPPALPFTKRTTASVTVFACYQQAKVAQTITSNGDTVVALQIELGQLFAVYKQLQRQDVTNQVVTLDAAINAAQVAILALNSTVQGMTVSGADNVKILANIRSVVANAVGTIAAVVANE